MEAIFQQVLERVAKENGWKDRPEEGTIAWREFMAQAGHRYVLEELSRGLLEQDYRLTKELHETY